MAERRPVVLSIAGFDPSAGAGVAADLKVFAAHRLYGMSAITALTVQSTLGVRRVEPVAPATLRETLETLAGDVAFAGIKLGMLATAEIVSVVAAFLRAYPSPVVVLDPVLRSSSGRALLEPEGVRRMERDLLPLVDWATPNTEELAALTGMEISGRDHVPAAARRLQEMAAGGRGLNVLATGGHLERPDDYLLAADGSDTWLEGQRVETTSTHGTGCALSSALLCRLVLGDEPAQAAAEAKRYVTAALRAAYPVGRGRGPMHHLAELE